MTITASGHAIELGDDLSVFVGRAEGDDSLYIRITIGETDTRVKVSPEAAKALHSLLGDAIGPKTVWMRYVGDTMVEEASKARKAT